MRAFRFLMIVGATTAFVASIPSLPFEGEGPLRLVAAAQARGGGGTDHDSDRSATSDHDGRYDSERDRARWDRDADRWSRHDRERAGMAATGAAASPMDDDRRPTLFRFLGFGEHRPPSDYRPPSE